MSTTKVTRFTDDGILKLANSQWAGSLNIGTNWSTLRIGWRWAMNDSGANIISTPRLYVGVMSSPASGMTNGPLGSSTSHWVGGYSVAATLTRSTSPTRYSLGMSAGKKIGGTITDASDFAGYMITADPGNVRVAGLLEITKGSPNFSLRMSTVAGVNGIVDVSRAALEAAMELSDFGSVDDSLNTAIGGSSTRYTASAAQAIAVDEATNGDLNAICVGWERSSPALEVSEILFAKMA